MKNHELKSDPGQFECVKAGIKTHELRKNDRAYEVGDTVTLRKTEHSGVLMSQGDPLLYTGDELTRTITYITYPLPWMGLKEGWVILSLAP